MNWLEDLLDGSVPKAPNGFILTNAMRWVPPENGDCYPGSIGSKAADDDPRRSG